MPLLPDVGLSLRVRLSCTVKVREECSDRLRLNERILERTIHSCRDGVKGKLCLDV